MLFWDRLFKKGKMEKSNEYINQEAEESIKQPAKDILETANDTLKQETPKTYHFEFALTDEEQQKRILDYVRPVTSQDDIINLMMVYGVREKESGLFLVRQKSATACDDNSDKEYYSTYFLVLDNPIYEVSYTSEDFHDKGELTYDIQGDNAEIIKGAFDFWRNWPAHKEFEHECEKETPGFSVLKLNSALRKPLYKELEEYELQQKKSKEASRQHMEILSEEDAKKLFFLCGNDYRRKMREDYDDETIEAFEKYSDGDKKERWIVEECVQILQGIIDGDNDGVYAKLQKVNGRCGYWLGTDAEQLVPFYTKACKTLFDRGEENFVVCIPSFVKHLRHSENPFCVSELLDMTEQYYREKNNENADKFKETCCELRGIMRELSEPDFSRGFRFSLINQDDLRSMVIWYRNLYNDDGAVKECVAELNCAYAVENDELLLTALSDNADSDYPEVWDRLSFIGILRATGELIEVRCRREEDDGSFVRDSRKGPVLENWALIVDAIEYYRNRTARQLFFEEYNKTHEENISQLKKQSKKGLLSRFKRHYEKEYKRVGRTVLTGTLIQLLDLCEERGGSYGYRNTKFSKPVTPDVIELWENENGISLPDDYKCFLCFADGGHFFGVSEIIFGLDEIDISGEFLEPGYIQIGNMIGDGTMICMSKEDGKVYLEDHGKYNDKGTFAEFLAYFVDFLQGF